MRWKPGGVLAGIPRFSSLPASVWHLRPTPAGRADVRIKIPFGGLTANQVRRVAELADQYATGVGHVTTRQDIQLHFVELKSVPTMMRLLAEVGLTTREACANTVRNVTACHLAGVCQGKCSTSPLTPDGRVSPLAFR
ncbi:MAG: hypothetical protein U0361_12110 [Nitrospiraceae bacterium]